VKENKIKNSKSKLLGLCCLAYILLFFCSNAYALDLTKFKLYFLKGEYSECINEGEKILANGQRSQAGIDELYYLLGLSYLKEGNYLRAADIFEIILSEFKGSKFSADARIGLGDVCFLKNDLSRARSNYEELISAGSNLEFEPAVYLRLAKIEFREGRPQAGQSYLDKIKTNFPLSPEAKAEIGLDNSSEYFYTVQVGSFSQSLNAQNFVRTLNNKGYPAYLEKANSDSSTVYRVRVGKLSSRNQAQELENSLTKEGYPTKIYP
jgi:tetratricopeptide (TPR) repeat protein